MGGGDGAKERRRLQRQMKIVNDGSGSGGNAIGTAMKQNISRNEKKTFSKTHSAPRNKSGKPVSKNSTAKKTTKVKKPKHLKRKLERLAPEEERSRETILREIEDFKRKKAKLTQWVSEEPKNFAANLQNISNVSRTTVPEENPVATTVDATTTIEESSVPQSIKILEPEEVEENGPADGEISHDDESVDEQLVEKRERGRRRRGRKDTAQRILESKSDTASTAKEAKINGKEKNSSTQNTQGNERYCIGRKPVTDFVIGEKYNGKVVYAKEFGVFFDIGCHSDAFCHVSRLRDDFVENPQEIFNEGDEFQTRVVEIDRKRKRITVSLQSDDRIADEKASVEARKERKQSRKQVRPHHARQTSSSSSRNMTALEDKSDVGKVTNDKNGVAAWQASVSKLGDAATPQAKSIPLSKMSPAEEKRARKLARRAARRQQAAAGEAGPTA